MNVAVRHIFVILLAVLLVYGCAPVIPYAVDVPVPPVPAEVSFSGPQQPDKSVLVIPVWKTRKGHIQEGKQTGYDYIIDDAFLIKSSQLAELHEIVPSRVSYGLGGLSSAYSADNYFLGMYLIADSGEAVLLARANLGWIKKEKTWKAILDTHIGKAWQEDLVATFRDATQVNVSGDKAQSFWYAEFAIPCEFFLRATGLRKELCQNDIIQNFPGEPIQLRLSPEKRKSAVDFLADLETNGDSSMKSAWVQRDTYSQK
jgi:hypothetical protein